MPIIVRLQFSVIHMYFGDHNPPHFHVDTPERGAVVAIRSLEVLDGEVDMRALREAREWAAAHRDELLAVWEGFKA